MGPGFDPPAAAHNDHDHCDSAYLHCHSQHQPQHQHQHQHQYPALASLLLPLLFSPVVFTTIICALSYLYITRAHTGILVAINRRLNPPRFPRAPAAATHAGAMSRLLGLSAPPSAQGIMASVTHAAKDLANSLPAMSASPSDAPAGLGNLNNSCFQNSVLQGLSALESMPAYLEGAGVLDGMHQGPEEAAGVSTAVALRNFVAALRGKHNNGRTLWTPARLKSLNTWQQQDAQEYFTKLLDEVEREMAKAARATIPVRGLEWEAASEISTSTTAAGQCSSDGDDSGYQRSLMLPAVKSIAEAAKMFKNPLEGLLAQRVACTACKHTDGLDMIPFNFLTLNLPTNTQKCRLDECLDAYTRVEDIEGVECVKCTLLRARHLLNVLVDRGSTAGSSPASLGDAHARLQAITAALEDEDFEWETVHDKCKIAPRNRVASTKTKHTVIARPPQSLVLHVNRSVFDELTGNMYKNTASLGYEPYLDLGRWCIGNAALDHATTRAVGIDDVNATSSTSDELQERWTVDPHTAMRSGDTGTPLNPTYRLRAVITHFGRHENGHYVCYKQKPGTLPQPQKKEQSEAEAEEVSKSQWWRISDETVIRITEEDMPVRTETGAFMLFYDCVGMTELSQSLAPQPKTPAETLPTAPVAVTPLTPPRDSSSPPPAVTRDDVDRPPIATEIIYPLTPESSANMDGPEILEEQKLPESVQPQIVDLVSHADGISKGSGAEPPVENRDTDSPAPEEGLKPVSIPSPALSVDGESMMLDKAGVASTKAAREDSTSAQPRLFLQG